MHQHVQPQSLPLKIIEMQFQQVTVQKARHGCFQKRKMKFLAWDVKKRYRKNTLSLAKYLLWEKDGLKVFFTSYATKSALWIF